MGTKAELSIIGDELLESVFDGGFQCSTDNFNQEKFDDVNWALNKGVWDFHLQFRKWVGSEGGQETIGRLNKLIKNRDERIRFAAYEEGFNKGRNSDSLRNKLRELALAEGVIENYSDY